MMLWLRARRAPVILPLSLAGFLALVLLVHNVFVVLPSITGRSQVALSLFIPIPLVAALMFCLESRIPAAENSGVRSVPRFDVLLTVVVTGAAMVASVAAGAVLNAPEAATAGRNVLFLSGLMLCGRVVAGQRAVMLPVGWLLVVVLLGHRPSGDPYPWTVVSEPMGALHATVGALLMLLAGTVVQLRTSGKFS